MSMISSTLIALLLIALSYLIGSVPFAVVVSRLMGLADPRSFGSKNPGATNVLRTGNRVAAALTLLGDTAKGWAAVVLAILITRHLGLSHGIVAGCAVAVFLGHVYPLFIGFKGGKGVATALGVLLGLSPWLALATAGTWLIIAYVWRYSSLASIVSAIFAPFYYLLGGNVAWRMEGSVALAIIVISVVLLYRHQANIGRLMTGKESRIGGDRKNPTRPRR